MPHISLLRRAVHTHAAARINTTYDACIESDTCLFIQITSSLSAPPSATFIAAASKLAKRFKQVVILPVGDVAVASVDAARMKDALMQTSPHLEIRVRAEVLDDAVGLVSLARHVLVHREAISALCGLIATGRVYHTEDVRGYFKQNEYKWLVVDKEALYEENVKEPDALRRLAYMGDVHASCCIFERFGKGDGEKIVCKNASGFRREACWVVSIGCDGKWSFERSILRKTGCVVHTFDCTGTWRVPEDLKHRVTFHKLCVSDVAKGAYRTWRDLIEIGSRSVSRTGIRMPALAKMDIEGFEYAVLNGLVDGSVETMLPEQLVLEVHVDTGNDRVGVPWRHLGRKHNRVGAAVVRGLFGGLEMRGYRLVHRADNPFCAHCSEVTLVRSVGLPEWRWHV